MVDLHWFPEYTNFDIVSVSVELMFDAHITKIPICLSFMSPI